MLWGLLAASAVGAAALALAGWHNKPSAAEAARPYTAPGVYVVANQHDFGVRRRGEVVSVSFVIRNTHPVPVTCGPVMKGCSCSAAVLEPETIPAGGEAKLTVVWNLANKQGGSSEGVVVPYRGEPNVTGTMAAQLRATVRRVVEPERETVDLTRAAPTATVAFTSPLGVAFRCLGVSASHPAVSAVVTSDSSGVTLRYDPTVKKTDGNDVKVTVVTDQGYRTTGAVIPCRTCSM